MHLLRRARAVCNLREDRVSHVGEPTLRRLIPHTRPVFRVAGATTGAWQAAQRWTGLPRGPTPTTFVAGCLLPSCRSRSIAAPVKSDDVPYIYTSWGGGGQPPLFRPSLPAPRGQGAPTAQKRAKSDLWPGPREGKRVRRPEFGLNRSSGPPCGSRNVAAVPTCARPGV